jgi:hypothetical protein
MQESQEPVDPRHEHGDAASAEPEMPETIDIRPTRAVRLVEHAGVIMAYPGPHRTPVLPSGWAPLTGDEQVAVLRACDAAPEAVVFKLGSLWEPGCEYRVYRLAQEHWAGLAIVAKHVTAASEDAGAGPACGERLESGNRQLLGLAWEQLQAVRIAVDFFNWDLEAHGQNWRLSVGSTSAPRP